ncbi:MAG: hypothetical protein ACRCSK_03210 [Fusobacteriaceae bacterium]
MCVYLKYSSKEEFEAKKKNEFAAKLSYHLKNPNVDFDSIIAIKEVEAKKGYVTFMLQVGFEKEIPETIEDQYYFDNSNLDDVI